MSFFDESLSLLVLSDGHSSSAVSSALSVISSLVGLELFGVVADLFRVEKIPIACATIALGSFTLEGSISVVPSFARFPNAWMYCSARRILTALSPLAENEYKKRWSNFVYHSGDGANESHVPLPKAHATQFYKSDQNSSPELLLLHSPMWQLPSASMLLPHLQTMR